MLRSLIQSYLNAYRGLPLEIWYLSLVLLINRAGTMVLVFLALYLTQDLGHGAAVAGGVLGLYGIGGMLGAFFGGRLCDRIGPLRVQLLSLFLSGLGFLFLEHLRDINTIRLAVFVLGITHESFRPGNLAALALFSPPELRARSIALNRIAINFGSAVGPMVGGFLAAHSYGWVFRIDGVTCIAAGFMAAWLFRGRLDLSGAHKDEQIPEGVGRSPLRDKAFLFFVLLHAMTALSFFQVFSSFPIYLKEDCGLQEFHYGSLMAVNGVMIIAFEIVLTHWVERFNPLRVCALGAFLTFIGFAFLPPGLDMGLPYLGMLLMTFVFTIGEMLVAPMAGGFATNRADPRTRGSYMGLFALSLSLAAVLGPPLGTWVYENLGPQILWYGMGGVGLLLLLGYEILHRWVRSESRRAATQSNHH